MDEKIRKSCPNCSQLYHLKLQSSTPKGNLPLFLSCGHSMCENCIRNIVKFGEPIDCKICQKDMTVEPSQVALLEKNKIQLYQIFPVNVHMVGELTLQLLEKAESKTTLEEKECFIDVQSILQEGNTSNAVCMECHHPTTKMCQQCAILLCNACFTKSHKNFVIFKTHVLKDIEQIVTPSTCKIHKDKPLDYYCNDCKKSICMDCLMVGGEKSCKNHNVASMQEVNDSFLEELSTVTPKVDETFRRLTKTAYDIGHLLYNIENETGSASELTQIIGNIEQHFSKLCSIVQKHKQEVMNIVTKLKYAEKNSLHTAKSDITNSIKKAKQVMDSLKITSDPNKLKQLNLSVLLDEAKEIAESPWYLTRDDVKKDPLKVAVNEDLCTLISDYIHLDGNAISTYKLCATADLGEDVEIPPPPPAPVFAPVLPKDVRQSKGKNKSVQPKEKDENQQPPSFFKFAPQYRAKSGSVTSLNSGSSENSSHRGSYMQHEGYNRPVVQPVQPFAESQHPKQLQEGAQELIYISHIVDPHNFYVQRACHQVLVKDMLREFRNAVSLPKPSVNHVAEGKTYLAFNKADNMWQRCRVVSIDRKNPTSPLFQVFCFDFGSTETVSVDKLRLLPPARVQSPYPLAINCSLANCVPKNGSWTSDDAILIQNIIDNKQAVIHIRNIRSTSSFSVTLECDVTTFEDGVSLVHALVFHERAKMPNPKLKYPPNNGVREKAKIFISNDDYKPKTMEEVCITHIENPDKFYVRKKYQQAVYEQLSLDLEQEYSLGVNAGSIYYPEIGMSCCVHVEVGKNGAGPAWARGVVTALPGRGRVRLSLVDTGASLLVHWSALRHLQPKFAKLSALATECHLAGVTPLNKKWSPGSVALMHKYAERFLRLHVEDSRNRGSIGVTLFYDEEETPICINQEMIKYKFAITFGIFSFSKDFGGDEQVITNKSPLDKPIRHPKPLPEVQLLKKNQPQKIKTNDLEAKDKGPLRLEAKVLQYQSPSLIYISLAHQQKSFNELFENMQKYYSVHKPTKKATWQAGDRCCTVCVQSQTWRRAVIIEITGDNAKVFYSDFATVETVPTGNLAELTPEFVQFGDAAIKCHLSGVIPAVGEEWPSLTKEFLKELLDSYSRVFITKLGHFKDKSMPVEIWAYHTIQGSALEPNKSEWRCLNRKIVDQGLGVPDKTAETSCTDTKTDEDDKIAFLSVKGSITDWLQLEPMPTKPLPRFSESPSASTTPVEYEDRYDGKNLASDVEFISDWLPPELLPRQEFTAMPTYIDNDGVIYLHDILQESTLDLIRKALDVRFKDPDPKAKYQKWQVGEPCIAMYFLDNRFYRGRVIDVNNEASTCYIHYIDYGNEEHCSFTNMRKSIALHQIPTQAHKCVLNRIRPVGKNWERQTLDYIHKSIVEKHCFIKVVGDTVDGITPVELKYDKLWINDHLVEFEMATFTDGSKAVVKKFAPSSHKENVRTMVVSDSDPDYIVEDTSEPSSSEESFETSSLKAKDWNDMLAEDSALDNFVTYPSNLYEEFKCNITVIHDMNTLELDIVHDENTTLMYEEMFRDIQAEGENMPPINGMYENKACIALFMDDHQWYRACILQYSETKGKVKVKYVDYGNIGIIEVSDIREIHADWIKMAPATVTVHLNGIKLNPEVDIDSVTKEYTETFLDKGPFIAKVIKQGAGIFPIVELKNNDGELVYQNLIDKDIFLKCQSE